MFRIIFFTVIIFLPSLLFSLYVNFRLNEVQEFTTPIQLLETQDFLNSNKIYQPRYRYNAYALKQTLLHYRKPDRISIGSSRAHQLDAEIFKDGRRFLNLGGTIRSLDQLYFSLEEITREIDWKIKETVIVLDFWWFRDNFGSNKTHKSDFNYEEYDFLVEQIKYEKKNKLKKYLSINNRVIFDLLTNYSARKLMLPFRSKPIEPCNPYEPVGLNAFLSCSGFNANGRFIRSISEAKIDDISVSLPEDMYFLNNGTFCKNCFELKFKRTLDLLANKGIKVTLIIPPIPQVMRDYINKEDGLKYVKTFEREVEKISEKRGIIIFNGHEGILANTGFYDKYHPTKYLFDILLKK